MLAQPVRSLGVADVRGQLIEEEGVGDRKCRVRVRRGRSQRPGLSACGCQVRHAACQVRSTGLASSFL